MKWADKEAYIWPYSPIFKKNQRKRELSDRRREKVIAKIKGYNVPAWMKYWSEQRHRFDGYCKEMLHDTPIIHHNEVNDEDMENL